MGCDVRRSGQLKSLPPLPSSGEALGMNRACEYPKSPLATYSWELRLSAKGARGTRL